MKATVSELSTPLKMSDEFSQVMRHTPGTNFLSSVEPQIQDIIDEATLNGTSGLQSLVSTPQYTKFLEPEYLTKLLDAVREVGEAYVEVTIRCAIQNVFNNHHGALVDRARWLQEVLQEYQAQKPESASRTRPRHADRV